ncbi:MAG: PEP-CTERM system TPR-repeat protein PrsT [Halioglobus sp.]|nr:PEP-CTERM system TPR-repeat protein PrsT [Halioglobus sp.]
MRRVSLIPGIVLLGCFLVACARDLTSEEHLKKGLTLFDRGQYVAAIVHLKASLNLNPDQAIARAQLGLAYYETGDVSGAEKELSRALALDGDVDPASILPTLAQVLLQIGDYSRLEELDIGMLEGESRSTAIAARGLALLYQDEAVAAEAILQSANEGPESSLFARVALARLAMSKHDYADAYAKLNAILNAAPDYVAALNLLGDVQAANRRPEDAESAYTRVLELSPRAFDARLNRAMMRIYQGNFQGARKDLQELSRINGGAAASHPGFSFAQGIAALEAGNLLPARKAFEKTAEFSYLYPLSYYYMAVIDLQEGQVERALTEVYRFLALAPESQAGPKLAARLELDLGRFAAAEMLLLPVLEVHPNDVEALNLLASAMFGQGRGGEGLELLSRVTELEPDSAHARTRLGAGYFMAGEVDSGIAVLQDTLRADPQNEQADILLVLNFLRKERVDEAIEAAKAFSHRNPGSSASYNLLGRAYIAGGNLGAASQAFNKALELNPADPAARHGLADIALAQKKYGVARSLYRQVLRYDNNRLQTQLALAASFAQEGREAEMLNYLRFAMDAHPDATEPRLVLARYYIATGQLDEAGPLFDSLSQAQRNQPDTLATLASFELASGHYNQALITLERLTSMRPDVAHYHYMLSKAYAGLGEGAQVLPALKRTIDLDPEHFYARMAFARLALLAGQVSVAEERLEELRAIAPDNPDVLELQLQLAQQRGDSALALDLLVRLQNDSPSTANVVALATHWQNTGKQDKALGLLESWVSVHAEDARAREKLAEIYEHQGRVGDVLAQYRAILSVDRDNVVALNNLAWYLLKVDPKQALQYAERAAALSPQTASVLDTLAMAQLRNDKPVAARRTLHRALELAPESPGIRLNQAKLQVAEGRRDIAVATLSSLLQDHRDFAERAEAEAFLAQLR